jgi:hypothetical protein
MVPPPSRVRRGMGLYVGVVLIPLGISHPTVAPDGKQKIIPHQQKKRYYAHLLFSLDVHFDSLPAIPR